jgi:hypothetical protein
METIQRPRTTHASGVVAGHGASGTTNRGIGSARLLSLALMVLFAVGAAVGLVVDDVYRDPASVEAMFRGYDLIALVIIVPALAVTLLPSLRRSARGRLVWTGLLAYSVYHSAMYVFGTTFNAIFLLHVATFSVSVFALGLALAYLDVQEIAGRFSERTPVRLAGGILLLLAATLTAYWSIPSLVFAFGGELPHEGSELVVPISITHLGWVLDLSLLVPAYAAAGVLLWRRAAWGYVLGTVVLSAGILQQVEYMTALAFQAEAGIRGATGFDAVEPFIAAVYVLGAIALLSRVQSAPAGAKGARSAELVRNVSGLASEVGTR